MNNELNNNIPFMTIKIISIFYICILYVLFGTYITTLLDEYGFNDMLIDNHDEADSIFHLTFETAIVVGFLAVFAFIGRNLILLIPFPFDGLFGFNYEKDRSVEVGNILLVFMFTFSSVLFNKIELLRTKLNDYKKNNKFIKVNPEKNIQTF